MYRVIVLCLCIIHLSLCEDSYEPEQIHISFGETVDDVVVTWTTIKDTEESIVEYGIADLDLTATGSSAEFTNVVSESIVQYEIEDLFLPKRGPSEFTNVRSEGRTVFIHRVVLPELIPGSKYTYRCGSSKGWSEEIWFNTLRTDSEWIPTFAIYGDLGLVNGVSIPPLETETQQGMYDAIFHIGDFAYDMYQNNGLVGDYFMNRIQPIAAYVPYMTCPGNHEAAGNFSDYRARFSMPGNTENLWYSINIGPAHCIFISTEVYYYTDYGEELVTKQYEWLEKDLMEATTAENRAKQPWIIIMGHRPMYCSNNDTDDCRYIDTVTRVGLPSLDCCGLEKLLYNYGVDVAIWAHEHSYERMWPLFDYIIMNGSVEEPYRNPHATVHITTGSAGCSEFHDNFGDYLPEWSAYRSIEYGYMRMQIHNDTHMYMEETAVAKHNEVIDSIWLIRETHGPFWK